MKPTLIQKGHLGKAIRAKRMALKWTQKDVCYLTGLRQSQISRVEAGGRTSISALSKICDALSLDFRIKRDMKKRSLLSRCLGINN